MAWLRTGLSFVAGGIAVAHLVPKPPHDSLAPLALGAAFVLAGLLFLWSQQGRTPALRG